MLHKVSDSTVIDVLDDHPQIAILQTDKDGAVSHAVAINDADLVKTIATLTEVATAKGLMQTSVSTRDEHPFHPLPEGTTPAALIWDAFVTSDGVERSAIAFVNSDGILILEAIGNERNNIEYAQFSTDDLRAMLALKENLR